MKKTIITAALTGAVTPAGHDIPTTPERIAEEAYACWKQGAAIVHLHMRDDAGKEIMDVSRFRKTIRLIRARRDCDVIINCTSSGATGATEEERLLPHQTLDGIEMGSYDAGSFNWMPGGVCQNAPAFLKRLGELYAQRGIKPEIEIFDTGMLGVADYFVKDGTLPAPCYYQLCLGVPGGMEATVENLVYLVNRLPAGAVWSAFGVGINHLPILYSTIARGGHVRLGMEDNVVFGIDEDGTKIKATNVMLVKRAADTVRMYGNCPATSAQAREMLGIPALDIDRVCAGLGI